MAKDDYDVIVYRILVYLYACFKGKILFEGATFREAVRKNVESDEYFARVLRLMLSESLISGLVVTKAWGQTYLIASDLRDMEITAEGIHYLKENSTMQRVGRTLKETSDIIADLASVLQLSIPVILP